MIPRSSRLCSESGGHCYGVKRQLSAASGLVTVPSEQQEPPGQLEMGPSEAETCQCSARLRPGLFPSHSHWQVPSSRGASARHRLSRRRGRGIPTRTGSKLPQQPEHQRSSAAMMRRSGTVDGMPAIAAGHSAGHLPQNTVMMISGTANSLIPLRQP